MAASVIIIEIEFNISEIQVELAKLAEFLAKELQINVHRLSLKNTRFALLQQYFCFMKKFFYSDQVLADLQSDESGDDEDSPKMHDTTLTNADREEEEKKLIDEFKAQFSAIYADQIKITNYNTPTSLDYFEEALNNNQELYAILHFLKSLGELEFDLKEEYVCQVTDSKRLPIYLMGTLKQSQSNYQFHNQSHQAENLIELSDYQNHLLEVDRKIHGKDQQITELIQTNEDLQAEKSAQQTAYAQAKAMIEEYEKKFNEVDYKTKQYFEEIARRDAEIVQLREIIKSTEDQIASTSEFKLQIRQQAMEIDSFKKANGERNTELQDMKTVNDSLKQKMKEFSQLKSVQASLFEVKASLEKDLEKSKATIEQLTTRLHIEQQEGKQSASKIEEMAVQSVLDSQEKDMKIKEQIDTIEQLHSEIYQLKQELANVNVNGNSFITHSMHDENEANNGNPNWSESMLPESVSPQPYMNHHKRRSMNDEFEEMALSSRFIQVEDTEIQKANEINLEVYKMKSLEQAQTIQDLKIQIALLKKRVQEQESKAVKPETVSVPSSMLELSREYRKLMTQSHEKDRQCDQMREEIARMHSKHKAAISKVEVSYELLRNELIEKDEETKLLITALYEMRLHVQKNSQRSRIADFISKVTSQYKHAIAEGISPVALDRNEEN